MLIILVAIAMYFVLTYRIPDTPCKLIAPKVVRHKSMIYVYDADTRACSMWYEYMDKGNQKRENTGLVIPLDKCPKEVKGKLI